MPTCPVFAGLVTYNSMFGGTGVFQVTSDIQHLTQQVNVPLFSSKY